MASPNQPASSQAIVSVKVSPSEEVLCGQAELHASDALFLQPNGLNMSQPEPSVSQQANVDIQTTDANGPVVSSIVGMQQHLDNPSASISSRLCSPTSSNFLGYLWGYKTAITGYSGQRWFGAVIRHPFGLTYGSFE